MQELGEMPKRCAGEHHIVDQHHISPDGNRIHDITSGFCHGLPFGDRRIAESFCGEPPLDQIKHEWSV